MALDGNVKREGKSEALDKQVVWRCFPYSFVPYQPFVGEMPAVGFGLWKLAEADVAADLILQAINAGCRRFDTAPTYTGTEQ